MEIVSVIHVLVCFFLIVIILFQSGKGGGVSGAFGGGIQGVASGNTTATVLGKITAYFAAAFRSASAFVLGALPTVSVTLASKVSTVALCRPGPGQDIGN